jgi:hypothetical protein
MSMNELLGLVIIYGILAFIICGALIIIAGAFGTIMIVVIAIYTVLKKIVHVFI